MKSATEAPSRLIVWIAATRPRTLPLAVAPVLVGSALARHSGSLDLRASGLCLLFAVLAQISANFANDYFDYIKGADTGARVGPRRAVASGLVSPRVMRNATIACCAAAFVAGLGLLPFGGWPLLVVGLASILCAVAYTGGPFPLGYHGLGDLFVILFFGPVAVCSTFFIQTGFVSQASILCSLAVGCLAANVLVVNNYRDHDTDRIAGKKTLVVRFGLRFARTQFCATHLLAFLVPLFLSRVWFSSDWRNLLLFVPLFFWAALQCRKLNPGTSPRELIALLGSCGLYGACYAVVLSSWILLA